MAKNNKTSFFYVLYCDKTWFFDQSEHVPGPIYIINIYIIYIINIYINNNYYLYNKMRVMGDG